MTHQGRSATVVDPTALLDTFRNIPLGLVVWQIDDIGDVRNLRLVDANGAAERELGGPLRDAIGKRIAETLPSLLKTSLPDCCRRVAVSGKPETAGEVRYTCAFMPDRIFWVDCFPLPGSCVGTALENITDRKKSEQTRSGALRLLHRITVAINDSTSLAGAAEVCLTEVCRHIGWPVGQLYLMDKNSKTRCVPKPYWHFSDTCRFRAFREATEKYEQDMSNKFLLECRVRQGKKAGLTQSLGFAVLEGGELRGVLEFSSEDALPLEETLISAVSDIGVQLGRVFERESAAMVTQRLHQQDDDRRAAMKKLRACTGRYAPSLQASLARLHGPRSGRGATSARQMASSIKLMQKCLAEMRQIGTPPIEFHRRDPLG